MKCPICNVEMIELTPEGHTDNSIFQMDSYFPKWISYTVEYKSICPKCQGQVTIPETKYYYSKE